MVDANTVQPLGAAKIVQLGSEKVLIVEVKADAPEGDYNISVITANPSGPTGADLGCIIRFGRAE